MNDLQNIATDDEAAEKHKYIFKSGVATIIVLLAILTPAGMADLCKFVSGLSGEICAVEYPLRGLSALLWLISPIAATIIWVVNHRMYSKAQDKFGSVSLRIIWSVALALYLIYANKHTGDLINELFKVDAAHFGTSTATLSLFYAPLEFYRSNTAKQIADAYAPYNLLVFGMAAVLFAWVSIKIFIDEKKEKNKKPDPAPKDDKNKSELSIASLIFIMLAVWACYEIFPARHINKSLKEKEKEHNTLVTYCAVIIFFSMWAIVAVYFVRNVERSLKEFIVWADFSDNHRCNDAWLQRGKGVVFLDGSNVLALIEPEPAIYERFGNPLFLVAGPCTYPSPNEVQAPFLKR